MTPVLLAGLFTTAFPSTILTIAVQPIAEDLDTLPSTVVWVTTAPLLAAAVATPLLGRFGDLFGHRRVYLAGVVTTLLFAIGAAVAWSATGLIAARTLSQVGAAATLPTAVALIFRMAPPGERVRASASVGAVSSAAAVIGVVTGGPLVDSVGWRAIFAAQAVLCVATIALAVLVVPRDARSGERSSLDVPGALLLAVATFTLTFGINRAAVWGWEPVPIACLTVAPFAVWALVLVERRAASPLLPLRVLGSRTVRVASGASVLIGAGYMGNFVVTPLYMQGVLGLTAAVTSLLTVPRALSILLAAPTAGRAGRRFGERSVALVSGLLLTLALVAMAAGAWLGSLVLVAITIALSGYLHGHMNPAILAAQASAVDERDIGLAASLQQTAFQIGAVVGIGLFTALAGDATTEGPFALVFLLTAACSLVATLVLIPMRDPHHPDRAAAPTAVRDEVDA
ncbi:MFS transporter [Trujillonella endophytica]|uniref:Major Facilitator Superfamily protein n=1 Tax=Trujillonella endophytica TaxID=673521 RepID=A0A1H8R7N2_9ACTN|nr:MFS transporter [Trujillella endophytica]SEO62400.1 Major Facilitator Superfamily protein [Trujillella endophytica]